MIEESGNQAPNRQLGTPPPISAESLLEESWIDFDVGIVSKAGNREYWLEEIIRPMLMGNDLDEPRDTQ